MGQTSGRSFAAPTTSSGPRQPAGTTGSSLAMPAAAAVASIAAATALSGVIGGLSWLSYVVVAVVVVAATGIALRAMRVPAGLIWLGQAFVLLCLLVTLFTDTGFLVVLPGPAALHDLGAVFAQAGRDVQTGIPPVPADQAILALVTMTIGLVAVAVDTLAVTAKVPAASGLILLCVYAVPASLDDAMLPWLSFVVGAAAFTVMLAVDGVQRHQAWRGKLGLPAAASAGVAPATFTVTTVAAVFALFVGGTFTVIGTVGRLPGEGGGDGNGSGGLGIKPFTILAGMLEHKQTTELFDVSGLPSNSPPYLTALTLSDYEANQGWEPDKTLPPGVGVSGPLPLQPGQVASDAATNVSIQPVNWSDYWMPTFGMPKRLVGASSDYHYDTASGTIYSSHVRHPDPYTEQSDLTVPTDTELRSAGTDYTGVDKRYLQLPALDPKVKQLADQLTANDPTPFDKAYELQQYFRTPLNGFKYDTQTNKPVTNDGLVDFLFYGKTGFCEQYASTMAVMLRALGIPTRVAIGFTDGYVSGGHRTITSQDAHAWVQSYFPGYGWVVFDPTPLDDGRTQVSGFSTSSGSVTSPAARQNPDREASPAPQKKVGPPVKQPEVQDTGVVAAPAPRGVPAWQVWSALVLGLAAALTTALTVLARRRRAPVRRWLAATITLWSLAVFLAAALVSWWLSVLLLVLGAAAGPAAIREQRRRRHHRQLAGPTAASAAWSELLAESLDRGMLIPDSDTLRVAAHRMAREHDLDDDGREHLRSLVGAVERSWYGREAPPDGGGNGTVRTSFDEVRASLRRNSPLAFRARLLPRSVLRPANRKRGTDQEQ